MYGSFKKYGWWLAGLSALELVSWTLYHVASGPMIGLIIVAIAALLIGWKKPGWLAYLTLAELVIGGKGYLLYGHFHGWSISLREILFLLLFLRALPLALRQWRSFSSRSINRSWLWLGLWLMMMVLWGWIRGNGLGSIFFDANGFIALLYLPLWWVSLTPDPNWRNHTLSIVLAGASLVGLKSLVIVFCFSHGYSFVGPLYHWIRDTGIGEITWIQSNIYRVFLQSQIYCLFVSILALTGIAQRVAPRWWWIPFGLSAAGTYISLSRSLWLGLAGALVIGVVTLIVRHSSNWWRLSFIIPVAVAAWLLTSWATNFPAVFSPGQTNTLIARLSSEQSAQAGTARANQIKPLLIAISHHAILGNGFGTAVTYFSTDPRVHGWRTTTAFELGYLDLWLKIGAVGLVIYGWWITRVLKRLNLKQLLPVSLAVVALLVTHLTSPYLNHPLGISWLALATLWAYV